MGCERLQVSSPESTHWLIFHEISGVVIGTKTPPTVAKIGIIVPKGAWLGSRNVLDSDNGPSPDFKA